MPSGLRANADGPIPRIDLTPLVAGCVDSTSAGNVIAQMRDACAGIGFMTITGHGVPAQVVEDAVAAARRFFELPLEAKLASAPRRWNDASPNSYRGYFPSSTHGKEGLDIGDPALTPKEGALLARPYYELNRYPGELDPDWREAVSRYFAALFGLGQRLLEALVASLGGDPARVAAAFVRPRSLSTLRLNFYPRLASPVESSPEDGSPLACETHVDSGVLTILYPGREGGLQVQDRTRRWHDVPFEPLAFVVNTGLALQRLSGGRFPATRHRVRISTRERLSIPFFFEPPHDLPVDPSALGLPGRSSPGVVSYEAFLTNALEGFVEYDRDS